MRGIGDRIKLPDGRHGVIVGVAVPIAAWKSANGRLMMEKKNRELEVEITNLDGSATRVFVMEEDAPGLLLPVLLAIFAVGVTAFCVWYGFLR